MSALLSHAIRRHFGATGAKNIPGTAATAGEHTFGYKIWKRLFLFVAMPAVGFCMLNAYLKHQKEHDKPRPEFVKYDYMRRREKRFPWGDGNKSLFHNPQVNALPDGYEP